MLRRMQRVASWAVKGRLAGWSARRRRLRALRGRARENYGYLIVSQQQQRPQLRHVLEQARPEPPRRSGGCWLQCLHILRPCRGGALNAPRPDYCLTNSHQSGLGGSSAIVILQPSMVPGLSSFQGSAI